MRPNEISDESIRRYIEAAYKKQYKVKYAVKRIAGREEFKPNYTAAPKTFGVKRVGERMKAILLKHIREDTQNPSLEYAGLKKFPSSAVTVEYPPGSLAKHSLPKGSEVRIKFDKELLRRESLEPEKYDGIDDVISLFVHGYTAKNTVSGQWHGKRVKSLRHRPPADDTSFYPNGNFIENAIAEFNKEFSGYAVARIIDKEYEL